MSVWFCSSRATVASVSGVSPSRLMIASRVHVMWSSQSLRMPSCSASALLLTGWAWRMAACAPRSWVSCALAVPFETASAASTLANAMTAETTSATGRETRFVRISDSFRLEGDGADGAPEQAHRGAEADHLDRLRDEGEAVDRLDLGMQERDTGRDREHVTPDQADEDDCRRGDDRTARRLPRQRKDQRSEEHGRGNESAAGAGALLEVLGDERSVDPRADRAADDHGVDARRRQLVDLDSLKHFSSWWVPGGVGVAGPPALTSLPNEDYPSSHGKASSRSAPVSVTSTCVSSLTASRPPSSPIRLSTQSTIPGSKRPVWNQMRSSGA